MSVDTVVAFVSWCFYIYTLFLLLHILLSWFQLPYNPLLNKVRGVLTTRASRISTCSAA